MTTPTPVTPPASPAPAASSRTLRTVLLIGGSVVLVGILVLLALQVTRTLSGGDASETVAISDGFQAVDIETTATDVTVEYGDVDGAVLEFDQGDTTRNLRFEHGVSAGVLRVEVDYQSWFPFNLSLGGRGSSLTVTLPERLAGSDLDLDIESTAGNISVSGDFGAIELGSTAGNLDLTGSATELSVDTTAGDVRVRDFALAGELEGESTAGEADYEFSTLPSSMTVTSTAGDITVTVPEGPYRIDTEVVAGDVELRVANDFTSSRVYSFETTAGDILVRNP